MTSTEGGHVFRVEEQGLVNVTLRANNPYLSVRYVFKCH